MKKITKKEIREVLRDAREEHPFGWRLASVTGYIYIMEKLAYLLTIMDKVYMSS